MTPDFSSMRPLRHEDRISQPELVVGAQLLAHVQPLARSELRKRRVWKALSASRSSRLGFRLSALHVAFASVLFAAVSSAAVGGYYVKYRPAEPPAAAPPPAALTPPPHHRRVAKHAPVAAVTPPSTPAATPEPANLASETANAPVRPAPTRGRADVAGRNKGAASDADAELLVEAMRARGSGDAKRVGQLVDEYRARHPQGVLQEEALILSIESAVAQHASNASALAREYLTRFPNGRFALQARRALGTDAR